MFIKINLFTNKYKNNMYYFLMVDFSINAAIDVAKTLWKHVKIITSCSVYFFSSFVSSLSQISKNTLIKYKESVNKKEEEELVKEE